MAGEVEVVIAATPREWAAHLTEWITDHGGNVRLRNHFVFHRSDALELSYDCLVIDAESTLLDAALVDHLRRHHRTIVGVFHPEEPQGRQRLIDLGVGQILTADEPPEAILDRIIEATATERRFREAITDLGGAEGSAAAATGGPEEQAADSIRTVVTGALEGAGATEIAIEVAAQLRRRDETAVLVDADLVAPNLAQRLRAPLTANVFAAIDAVRHTLTDPTTTLTTIRESGFELLGGLEHPKDWKDLDTDDLLAVLEALGSRREHLVVNVGSQLEVLPGGRHAAARALLRSADRVLVVTDAMPAGLVRVSRWMVDAVELTDPDRVHVVFNRSDSGDARAQLESELLRTVECAGVWHVPSDQRLRRAAWEGTLAARGRFTKAVAAIASGAIPSAPRQRRQSEPVR